MKRLALGLITLYQRAVSPMLPPACRFTPTCSEYAKIAVETHGVARGGLLAAKRIARCHPFHPGGYDPVPGTAEFDRAQLANDSTASDRAPSATKSAGNPGQATDGDAPNGQATDQDS